MRHAGHTGPPQSSPLPWAPAAAPSRPEPAAVGPAGGPRVLLVEVNGDGTTLTRGWNGQCHRVMVVDAGFVWNGKTYDSLSRIAFAITGSKWNGPRFFGLRDKASVEANP